eukprot:4896692-Amphidinium_carterae.1
MQKKRNQVAIAPAGQCRVVVRRDSGFVNPPWVHNSGCLPIPRRARKDLGTCQIPSEELYLS